MTHDDRQHFPVPRRRSKPKRWSRSDIAARLARVDRASLGAADVESNTIDAAAAPLSGQAPGARWRIHVHSRRRRLADPDGVSAKWAIDGLVQGGLLPDDSAQFVEMVTFSQEKAERDETVIEVWEELKNG